MLRYHCAGRSTNSWVSLVQTIITTGGALAAALAGLAVKVYLELPRRRLDQLEFERERAKDGDRHADK